MNYQDLVSHIDLTHGKLQVYAANAVNQSLTIRNWLIGFYIIEYEQNGNDKAKYGDNIIDKLATSLKHIKGIDARSLRRFRQFYLTYHYFQNEIWGTVTPILDLNSKWGTVTPILKTEKYLSPKLILSKLSYSHLELLIPISDFSQRLFYELECIKGIWSVRELKRQINSLLYERTGLSSKPDIMLDYIQNKIESLQASDIIKSVYTFDFLNLNSQTIIEESDLEIALLNHLQEFIIELGHGFCLEARQKRILIGEKYYFVDLVFYHRILKCHVLIELKIGEFEHGDIGQLNTYLNYYKKEVCTSDDNPPIGIMLVAEKEHALVEYATAGMDENLFIQKYLIQLPSKKMLIDYIESELKKH